ncbi:MAG TPA: hypothetical protein VKP30_08990 [Polyangiaceae bacterium]|nr:hypothetical protein [Polyangiaceae bacterium]
MSPAVFPYVEKASIRNALVEHSSQSAGSAPNHAIDVDCLQRPFRRSEARGAERIRRKTDRWVDNWMLEAQGIEGRCSNRNG